MSIKKPQKPDWNSLPKLRPEDLTAEDIEELQTKFDAAQRILKTSIVLRSNQSENGEETVLFEGLLPALTGSPALEAFVVRWAGPETSDFPAEADINPYAFAKSRIGDRNMVIFIFNGDQRELAEQCHDAIIESLDTN